MKALAFDQATAKTGWAIGDERSDPRQDRPALFGTIKAPKRDEFGERLAIIWREANALIVEHQPEIIAYEEPYFPFQGAGSGSHKPGHYTPASGFLGAEVSQSQDDAAERGHTSPETLKQLQMVKGLIITIAALRGIPCYGAPPSTWRKTFLGYGRAPKGSDKDHMKHAVMRRCAALGYDVRSSDPADALGLLYHTLHGPEASARKQGDLLSMAGAGL
jgi:Holliday junction resolvasome RuvABC endonuclease subunit